MSGRNWRQGLEPKVSIARLELSRGEASSKAVLLQEVKEMRLGVSPRITVVAKREGPVQPFCPFMVVVSLLQETHIQSEAHNLARWGNDRCHGRLGGAPGSGAAGPGKKGCGAIKRSQMLGPDDV